MVDPRKRTTELTKLKADFPELDELETRIRTLSKHYESMDPDQGFSEIIGFLTSLINLEISLLNREKNELYKEQLEELQLNARIGRTIDLANAYYIKYKIILQKSDSEISSRINVLTAVIVVLTYLLIKLEVASHEGPQAISIYGQSIPLNTYHIDALFTVILIYLYLLKDRIFQCSKLIREKLVWVKEKLNNFFDKRNIFAMILMFISFIIIFIIPVYVIITLVQLH